MTPTPTPPTNPEPSALPCQSGDRLAEMNCPNMKSDGSTWDSDSYACAVCGKRYTTHDEDMK